MKKAWLLYRAETQKQKSVSMGRDIRIVSFASIAFPIAFPMERMGKIRMNACSGCIGAEALCTARCASQAFHAQGLRRPWHEKSDRKSALVFAYASRSKNQTRQGSMFNPLTFAASMIEYIAQEASAQFGC